MAERGKYQQVALTDTKATDLLSVDEAARLIGVTSGRIRQLLSSGELRGEKFRNLIWQIRRSDAEKFANQPEGPGRPRSGRPKKK